MAPGLVPLLWLRLRSLAAKHDSWRPVCPLVVAHVPVWVSLGLGRDYSQFRLQRFFMTEGAAEITFTRHAELKHKSQCMGRGRSIFQICTESHHTMLAVGKVTPIGQPEEQARTAITKHKSLKSKQRHQTSQQRQRGHTARARFWVNQSTATTHKAAPHNIPPQSNWAP